MSQAQAWAEAKKKDVSRIKKLNVILNVLRWIFPAFGLIVLAFTGLSYLGDRGEGDVVVATEGLEQAQSDYQLKTEELHEHWALAVEGVIGVPVTDLEMIDLSQEVVVNYLIGLESPEGPLFSNHVLQGYNPVLRSINEDGSASYVVELNWLEEFDKDGGEETTQSGFVTEYEVAQSGPVELSPYVVEEGLIEGSTLISDSSRHGIVWFTIKDAEGLAGHKKVTDLSGYWATAPQLSR